MKIILGSGSPRRKDILGSVGVEFEVIVSDCEEIITKTKPEEIVAELSCQKAQDVYDKVRLQDRIKEDILIIGADTIVSYDGIVYGKPKDEEEAVSMLTTLSGSTHQVYTGVTYIYTDSEYNIIKRNTFFSGTDVVFEELTHDEICAYVDTKEPMDKAGAYAIQGGFARYIGEIHGEYNNVVGFPVARFFSELKKDNISII